MTIWMPKDKAAPVLSDAMKTVGKMVHPAERPELFRDLAKAAEAEAKTAEKTNEEQGVPDRG